MNTVNKNSIYISLTTDIFKLFTMSDCAAAFCAVWCYSKWAYLCVLHFIVSKCLNIYQTFSSRCSCNTVRYSSFLAPKIMVSV